MNLIMKMGPCIVCMLLLNGGVSSVSAQERGTLIPKQPGPTLHQEPKPSGVPESSQREKTMPAVPENPIGRGSERTKTFTPENKKLFERLEVSSFYVPGMTALFDEPISGVTVDWQKDSVEEVKKIIVGKVQVYVQSADGKGLTWTVPIQIHLVPGSIRVANSSNNGFEASLVRPVENLSSANLPASPFPSRFETVAPPKVWARQQSWSAVIGFEVPQLPKGRYKAWHDSFDVSNAVSGLPEGKIVSGQSKFFRTIPTLKASGSIRGRPGTDVTVRIGFTGPSSLLQKGSSKPFKVAFPAITLTVPEIPLSSGSPPIPIISGVERSQTKRIEANHYATWVIHINAVGKVKMTASAPGFEPLELLVEGYIPPPTARLEPGDLLLVVGTTPFVTDLIRNLERGELGEGRYSHAALYLGKINGIEAVAEMLAFGHTIRTLQEAKDDNVSIDVYRWRGIDSVQQQAIIEQAMFYSDHNRFVFDRFAYEQLNLLLNVAMNPNPSDETRQFLNFLADLVDVTAGGKKAMICSEFVTWTYRDVNLSPSVSPWPSMITNGILSAPDRHVDYTTPNMLAKSPNFEFVFGLK